MYACNQQPAPSELIYLAPCPSCTVETDGSAGTDPEAAYVSHSIRDNRHAQHAGWRDNLTAHEARDAESSSSHGRCRAAQCNQDNSTAANRHCSVYLGRQQTSWLGRCPARAWQEAPSNSKAVPLDVPPAHSTFPG